MVSEEIAGSNPAGGAGVRGTARYENRQSDPAQTRGSCGFDSHPCYSRRNDRVVLLTAACKTVAIEL